MSQAFRLKLLVATLSLFNGASIACSQTPATQPACCETGATPAMAILRAMNMRAAATQQSPTTNPTPTSNPAAPQGMVLIPAGEFDMGVVPGDTNARTDESPRHRVRLDAYYIDRTEVTNAQFRAFVKAIGYVTTAERKPDWDELKKQLPPNTPKPPDSVLVPGSLVFVPTPGAQSFQDWWQWTPGADWQHPAGPKGSVEGKDQYPVVQVSWDDAVAYAKWAGKSLPTEAEWEYAARGGRPDAKFSWGNDEFLNGKFQANYWQGSFPQNNTAADGFAAAAPVGSFAPNGFGLYDMLGNVWEWTTDWYRPDSYQKDAANAVTVNPAGPTDSFDPDEPTVPKHSLRGGSYLCHTSYCFSYRCSARMKASPDSSTIHQGFRCVQRIGPPAH